MSSESTNPYLGGIDPGLNSGGLVIIDPTAGRRVLAAASLVPGKSVKDNAEETAAGLAGLVGGWGDKEFTAAVLRSLAWMNAFRTALDDFEAEYGRVRAFGIESFVDQRSRAREEKQRLVKNRWHTPLVIGMLVVELEQRGYSAENGGIVYQNAGIVITQQSDAIARLEQRTGKGDMVVPGDKAITNDHLRKALAHAIALDIRDTANPTALDRASAIYGKEALNA